MCMGGSSSTPEVKKAPIAPPVITPIEADPTSRSAADQERKRRQAASGHSDTILTTGLGIPTPAPTGRKTLG
ncbi:MAG: hypothetical protein LBC14_05120 [Desulfovibrio sp.]|jgi:hypothetical protein|nr:hypothetical protein [Desulfovibrio sp.]